MLLMGRMARCSCRTRVRQLAEVHFQTGLLTRPGGRALQVLIVPGFVTTKLEVWQGVNCSTDEMRCAGVSAAQPLLSEVTAFLFG